MLNNFFDIQDEFNFETEKQNLINNLDMLKSMLFKNKHCIRNG